MVAKKTLVQESWSQCCSQKVFSEMSSFQFLVHAVDPKFSNPEETADKIRSPRKKLLSLSYISESKANTFLSLPVGIIYRVPSPHFVASSTADFGSNNAYERGPIYSNVIGLHTPEKLLSESESFIWNEVLVAEVIEKGGTRSAISAQGIFIK